MNQIRVFAPATVANVACGFDILGFAISSPGDEVVVRLVSDKGVRITKIQGDQGELPYDVEKNTAGVSVLKYLEHIKSDQGIEIELYKNMPLGSGLGSSASSSVATVYALNELLGKPLSKKEMLPFVMEAERVACGSPHADNVAPSLIGGIVLIRSYDPLDIIEIPVPDDLYATVAHPHTLINTSDSRSILRKTVKLEDSIKQWGNVAGLIAGLMKSDYDLIGRSLNDVIVEPVRSLLIPGFSEVKKSAIDSGALGCSISGSGPSIFALCKGKDSAEKVGSAMKDVFGEIGLDCDCYVSGVNRVGPRVIT